jgi:predicted glutamine amidotransferase
MCRWLAYSGAPIHLDELLFRPEHNLIDQSLSARSMRTPTNGDGYGVGWYGKREKPGLFRSIRPAWNDANLREVAEQIVSPLFLAHIRATSLAAVQETNCHPFRYGRWLFVHNGQIAEVQKFRRELLLAIEPALFENILGSTDSELMFHLALGFGLEKDPQGALERMAGFVETTAKQAGVEPALWMTLGISDGESLYAVCYGSDGKAPTLYHSRSMQEVRHLNPGLACRFGAHARCIVSEPMGEYAELFQPVAPGSFLHLKRGELALTSFHPQAPRRARASRSKSPSKAKVSAQRRASS